MSGELHGEVTCEPIGQLHDDGLWAVIPGMETSRIVQPPRRQSSASRPIVVMTLPTWITVA